MSQKIYMYDSQWQALLSAIGQGDTSALVTALNAIATAIQNQQITLDFSNITSGAIINQSNVSGTTVTNALNNLNNNKQSRLVSESLYENYFTTELAINTAVTINWTNSIYDYKYIIVRLAVNGYSNMIIIPRQQMDTARYMITIQYDSQSSYLYNLEFQLNSDTSAKLTARKQVGWTSGISKSISIVGLK